MMKVDKSMTIIINMYKIRHDLGMILTNFNPIKRILSDVLAKAWVVHGKFDVYHED